MTPEPEDYEEPNGPEGPELERLWQRLNTVMDEPSIREQFGHALEARARPAPAGIKKLFSRICRFSLPKCPLSPKKQAQSAIFDLPFICR